MIFQQVNRTNQKHITLLSNHHKIKGQEKRKGQKSFKVTPKHFFKKMSKKMRKNQKLMKKKNYLKNRRKKKTSRKQKKSKKKKKSKKSKYYKI